MSYQGIDVTQNPSLGMFRRDDITINGNPPALVHTHLRISSHTVDYRSQLRAEEEDVNPSVAGNIVELSSDRLLQHSRVEVADKGTIDINGSASLHMVSLDHEDSRVLFKVWRAKRTKAMGLSFRIVSRLLWTSS